MNWPEVLWRTVRLARSSWSRTLRLGVHRLGGFVLSRPGWSAAIYRDTRSGERQAWVALSRLNPAVPPALGSRCPDRSREAIQNAGPGSAPIGCRPRRRAVFRVKAPCAPKTDHLITTPADYQG